MNVLRCSAAACMQEGPEATPAYTYAWVWMMPQCRDAHFVHAHERCSVVLYTVDTLEYLSCDLCGTIGTI